MEVKTGFTLILCCLVISAIRSPCQTVFSSARTLSLAGATAGIKGTEGLFNNPGSLIANSTEWLATAIRPYSNLGLNSLSAGILLPVRSLNTGVALSIIGDDLYQYSLLSIALARDFKRFSIGLRPEWHREDIEGRKQISEFYLSGGSYWQLTDRITAGIWFRKGLKTEPQVLHNALVNIGITWQASKEILVLSQWVNGTRTKESITVALMYSPSERLSFLTGLRISPARWHAGISWKIKKFRMDFGTAVDPYLGSTYAFSINWNKKPNK